MSNNHAIRTVSSDGLDLQERVVDINRVAKVVKGGRRFSFTALVVVGDEKSIVGIGYGKANEVPIAIQKGVEQAKKNLFVVPKYKTTITHRTVGRFGAGQVMLKPAAEGAGVIAGGGVRAVLELAGVRDILAKSLGTQNPINLVKATVAALQSLRRPEDVAKMRGLSINDVLGIDPEARKAEAAAAAAAEAEAAVPATGAAAVEASVEAVGEPAAADAPADIASAEAAPTEAAPAEAAPTDSAPTEAAPAEAAPAAAEPDQAATPEAATDAPAADAPAAADAAPETPAEETPAADANAPAEPNEAGA